MFMGAVVVQDNVNGFAGWHLGLEGIGEVDELLMPVALHTTADDLAFEHIESGEQRGGAVTHVIVSYRASPTCRHGQAGLGAVEGLDLAHMGICGSRCSDQDSMVNLRSLLRIQGLSPFA